METIITTNDIRSAREIREAGKAKGLKGNKLTAYVNAELARQQPAADAATAHLVREGWLVKQMATSKSGRIVTVKYQAPTAASAQSRSAKLAAENDDLRKRLAELEARFGKTPEPATINVPAEQVA